MSVPTPLQSFLGGIGLSLPVHALLIFNGSVFGISGFLHRTFRGDKEAATALAGLVLGGAAVGLLIGAAPEDSGATIPQLIISGLLVGAGSKVSQSRLSRQETDSQSSKMANGCTSG